MSTPKKKAAPKKKKTKKPVVGKKKAGRLETPAHGVGKLKRGGNPGNRGGGRPRSAIREASAAAYDKRIPILEQIADDNQGRAGERIRAIDVLGRQGGVGQRLQVDPDLIRMLAADVAAEVEDEAALEKIYERWTVSIGARLAGDI